MEFEVLRYGNSRKNYLTSGPWGAANYVSLLQIHRLMREHTFKFFRLEGSEKFPIDEEMYRRIALALVKEKCSTLEHLEIINRFTEKL